MTYKYVLTGQPGAGKSTLLRRLGELGYYTVGEAAEYIKNSRAAQGRPGAEHDREGFQQEILHTQLRWEREIPKSVPVAFLDRGLHDGIAYYQIDGRQPPQELWDAAWAANYAGIFFLEPGKAYQNTKVRPESPQLARELGERTKEVYKKWWYSSSLIEIPHASLDEQVGMVLDRVRYCLRDTPAADYLAKLRSSDLPREAALARQGRLPLYE